MKNQQREQAQNLYFTTNLTKTEIAQRVNVDRRTILSWSQQGSWDILRKSSRHVPALIAEKCYYLLDQYATHLINDGSVISSFGHKQAQTLHLLATTINKVKNRSTVNESMELLHFFTDGLRRRDPELTAQVVPYMEQYMAGRANVSINDFLMDEFNAESSPEATDKKVKEQLQDEQDHTKLMEEFEVFLRSRKKDQDTGETTQENTATNQNDNPPATDGEGIILPVDNTPPNAPVQAATAIPVSDYAAPPLSDQEKARHTSIRSRAEMLIRKHAGEQPANIKLPSGQTALATTPGFSRIGATTYYKKCA